MTLLAIVLALASPLQGANDYVFTVPQSNVVRGIVMGDTNSYATLRFEDIAFLSEAAEERNAFVWDVSRLASLTNGISTNNQIRIIRKELPIYREKYLVDTNILSVTPRVIRDSEGVNNLTNRVTLDVVSWSMNVYTNATSTIEQAMTNGTVNVYTNSAYSYMSNVIVRVSSTNSMSYADFCCKTAVVTLADVELPKSSRYELFGPYAMSTITNLYGTIRRMRYTVPRTAASTVDTNNAYTVISVRTGDTVSISTNRSARTQSYSFEVESSRVYRLRQYKSGDEWVTRSGDPTDSLATVGSGHLIESLPLMSSTGIEDAIVTYRTSDPRVTSAYSFARVVLSHVTESESWHTESSSKPTDFRTNMTVTCEAMVPLGLSYRTNSTDNLTFHVNVPASIYGDVAELTGLILTTPYTNPQLPTVGSPQWHYTDDEDYPVDPTEATKRYIETVQLAQETTTGSMTIYLVLIINPTTKLQSWYEYD